MKGNRGGIAVAAMLIVIAGAGVASAEWMWTPESGKWISEKNIEKKSAMLLYEQAQTFEQAGDMTKAISVYRKLIKQYPASSVAPDAQYWVGHLLEEQAEYYKAYKEYQKVIENYPSYKKFNEILEREYQIGNLYLSGEKLKLLGIAMLPAVDKSIEIFENIVRTAPYSPIAARAQFNIGEAYRKIKRFAEAIPEYQKVVDNYSESDLCADARYQIGQCSYQKTLKASYDQTNTDIALESLETVLRKDKESKKSVEIKQRIDELTSRKAKKSYDIAEFYNKAHADESAIIYYQEVIENFPQSEYAKLSSKKIDALVAHPTRKKHTEATVETAKAKKGFMAGLWPFGKKETVVAAAAAGPTAAKIASPKKSQKPFWAFWVKDQKKVPLASTPDAVAQKASADVAPLVSVPIKTEEPMQAAPSELLIKAYTVEKDGNTLRLIFETNGDMPFKTFYLKDPARILVSFSKGVFSNIAETVAVNSMGVQTIRQHFRSSEAQPDGAGRPLNAIVVDLDKGKEAKIYNELHAFVIEIEKG